MRAITFILTASLVAQVYCAACPFELLKRSGVLSEEDIAKFEAVKRDPGAAEELFQAHRRAAEADPQPEAEPALIGPILGGLLDLPLGGGLRTLQCCLSMNDAYHVSSEWCSPATHWCFSIG